mmetsp:Transcript_45708/g.146701  ORF Transcript_45708/g.146701 Transcript_45708/m.146701 type:complete len:345 (-) Transcript_45708:141-1175(-)
MPSTFAAWSDNSAEGGGARASSGSLLSASAGAWAPAATARPFLVPQSSAASAGTSRVGIAGVGIAGHGHSEGRGAGGGIFGSGQQSEKLAAAPPWQAQTPPTTSGTTNAGSLFDEEFLSPITGKTTLPEGLDRSFSIDGLTDVSTVPRQLSNSWAETTTSGLDEGQVSRQGSNKACDIILPPNSKAIRQLREGGSNKVESWGKAGARGTSVPTASLQKTRLPMKMKEVGTEDDVKKLLLHLKTIDSTSIKMLAMPVQDHTPEIDEQPRIFENQLGRMLYVNRSITPKKLKSKLEKLKVPDLGEQEMFPNMTGEAVYLRMQELVGNPKAWSSSNGPPSRPALRNA